jgi:PRTRC genetic system protein A
MFDNLVTYHVHKCDPLPANNALAYQYVLAGNGLFIRAETRFFEAVLPIAPCTVRGLAPLRHHFRLKVPQIPAHLLDTILANARRTRRPDGGLNEVLYQFHHHGQTVQVKKPPQQVTTTSVLATGIDDPAILCDLHSHGNMRAFFSRVDDADEQATRVYAVIGKLDTSPEMRLRVGVYGYWLPLPVTAVFTGTNPFDTLRAGPFQDLYQKENGS